MIVPNFDQRRGWQLTNESNCGQCQRRKQNVFYWRTSLYLWTGTFLILPVVKSGYTRLGVQTAAFADGRWWFGCYGSYLNLRRASSATETSRCLVA